MIRRTNMHQLYINSACSIFTFYPSANIYTTLKYGIFKDFNVGRFILALFRKSRTLTLGLLLNPPAIGAG